MCSTGCKTQDHSDWGTCVRSKALQYEGVEAHQFNTGVNRTLDEYRAVRAEGIQPEGVSMKAINQARQITDITGTPFRADEVG